jgi:hypothetical protein
VETDYNDFIWSHRKRIVIRMHCGRMSVTLRNGGGRESKDWADAKRFTV